MKCIGGLLDKTLKKSEIEQITPQQAGMLQALETDACRLRMFKDKVALETSTSLTVDTPVSVEVDGQWLKGIVRYIGRLTEPTYPDAISGTFFGIELQGNDRGKGQTDGSYMYKIKFTCKKNCGVFAPCSKVRPDEPKTIPSSVPQKQSSPEAHTEPLTVGDRVTFFLNDEKAARYGMVMALEEAGHTTFVCISTDKDEYGKAGGEVRVPLDCVIKEELLPEDPEGMDVDTYPKLDVHPMGMGVGSVVKVALGTGLCRGIIRWIGFLPGRVETMAGLELEQPVGVGDGTFQHQRFFTCPPKQALFIKLVSCRLDSHFQNESDIYSADRVTVKQVEDSTDILENVPPISTENVDQVLIGRMKGIQGHINSCYMDSALFSLFSCTSVVDSLLFKSTEKKDRPIQKTLLCDIVNPLRSQGFVEGRHIMKLRQQLQQRGYSHSYTSEEKDPEEFLTLIMHYILCLEPLLKLSAGGKVQESYCYQIFLDSNHRLVLPTVQQLLEHSFHSAALKLAEVPSCLILQMPRFGKKYKMFEKIIPSLELDITDLLSEGPQQCVLCGEMAYEECVDCFRDPAFSTTGLKLFCQKCSTQVHTHPQRRSHKPSVLQLPEGYAGPLLPREKLQLFAVLCIETSHYVSFIKHGPNSHDWIFFDSMADREGERDGYNIPEVQACPEVAAYLKMSPLELANQVPRDMKGVAKRLFCDAYMYLYESPSLSLYR